MGLTSDYKSTEFGALPNEWKVAPIKELQPFITSGSRGWAEYYSEFGDVFVRITNMDRDCIYLDLSDLKFVNLPGHKTEGRRTQLQEGDVLISITADIGISGYVDQTVPLPAYINQHVALVRFDNKNLNSKYISYFLAGEAAQKRFTQGTDTGAKAGMSLSGVANTLLVLPTKEEQNAIANALSDVDGLLAKLEQLIAKKSDIKKGAMQELLTGKRRLPGFSGDWQERTLGEMFTFSGGHSASRADLSHKGHCYLHYGDIHLSKRTFIDLGAEQADLPKLDIALSAVSRASLLEDGDVVFVDASEDDEGVSKYVVVNNPDGAPFISGLHTIVAKSITAELDNRFKRFCFQTVAVKEQFKFFAVGTKVSGISKTNIAKIQLHFPCIDEQMAIAALLADMEAEIEELEAKRAKMADIKQGMTQQLLTGKIRLV